MRNQIIIFTVLIIIAAAGIAGTVYFGIRAADTVKLERKLNGISEQFAKQRESYWEIIGNYRRGNEQLSVNNSELERHIDQLQSDITKEREQYRLIGIDNDRLRENLGRLERNNRELNTVLLGIATRSGYTVCRDNSR